MSAQPASQSEPDVRLVGPDDFAPLLDRAAEIYGAAMQRTPDLVQQRRDIIVGHLDRQDFVAAIAVQGETLLGFGYGYRGRAGEWWHDVVAAALGRDDARRWMSSAFELAELHVDPARHGEGLGRRLLGSVLGAATGATVVLSTHDRDSPARSLYRSVGFLDLLRDFRFPGSPEVYAVMGLDR